MSGRSEHPGTREVPQESAVAGVDFVLRNSITDRLHPPSTIHTAFALPSTFSSSQLSRRLATVQESMAGTDSSIGPSRCHRVLRLIEFAP